MYKLSQETKESSELPPPPSMRTKEASSSATDPSSPSNNKKKPTSPPRSGAVPHLSNTSIPTLSSAPPSGNFNSTELEHVITAENRLKSSKFPLPPPPPPPPRKIGGGSAGSSSTTTSPSIPAMSASATPTEPTIAPLPPPPVMTTSDAFKPKKPDPPQQPPPPQEKEAQNQWVAEKQEAPKIRTKPTEPDPLPSTAFAAKGLQILAKRQTHIPILIIATEAANQMAWKNQLRLNDLLEGLVQSVTSSTAASTPLAPFRSVTRPLHMDWEDIRVGFVETIPEPLTDEQAQQLLQQQALLQEADGNLQQELNLLEDQVDNLLQEEQKEVNPMEWFAKRQEQLEQVTKDAFALTSPVEIPWLWRYRHALDIATDGLEHDLLACPPLCLLVCTTHEMSNPLETLRSLQSPHYLPRAFHNGLYDPNGIRQEMLVLHDNVEGPEIDEVQLRYSLQNNFGPGANIVRINSISSDTAAQLATEETSDLWSGGGSKGNCLSVSDRVVLRKYLGTLITSSLLPALERRISTLNAVVSDRKKGVKNVLKSFWRAGKTKEEEEEEAAVAKTTEVKYRYDTVESQTRLLADTLFLMKDYDAALGTYRLIKDDYKQDKSMVHYGSVQEMMALCMYFLDSFGRAREIFFNIENALLSYNRAAEEERPNVWGDKPNRPVTAPQATRLATRLCLSLTSTQNICNDRHLEVADLLASASSNETSLGAAVLLEQSSSHYFKADMYRKYAFHMLMSGHMFRSAAQEHHAFRCFTSALYIYRDGKWDELHNHLRSALAAQLFSMDRMAVSLQLYAKLVGSTGGGRVSVKSQQKFVNHLLEICNEHTKKALVGADRMAAPAKLSSAERDAVRKERLERIVQVVRYTKSASRVLELPNMDLPFVDDSTVSVTAEEVSRLGGGSVPTFGDVRRGSEEVWDQLMLAATAELRALDKSNLQMDDDMVTKALAKIEDPEIRRVIAQIDKEKANRNLKERAKRSANYRESPPVRAMMEPITVEFALSNPLGIEIDLAGLQLVARMTDESGEKLCTSEDAIKITPLASYNESNKWNFHSSPVEFQAADFCRVSFPKGNQEKQAWKCADEVDPFFVVTKADITMDPESQKYVSASITPLVQGDLEILGVRCRLFDDIWVYHPFDVKGPLLQNTRSNRANRVRAESLLLKAKVERGMPCLTADLVSMSPDQIQCSGPSLQGQISSWNLRISNVGTAAASTIALKTNVPWVNLCPEDKTNDSRSHESLEMEPTSFCTGPSGTLMTVPIKGPTLKVQGRIQPGETVDVPIEIRTSGSGRQEFYLLLRYELVDETAVSDRHRWLRKMFEVPVYPSMSLSAVIMPSYSAQSEHILSVEFTNNRSDRPDMLDILLEKLSLASRFYRLEPLPGQLTRRKGETSVLQLGWQERMTVHYRVVPLVEESTTCLLSECSLTGDAEEDSTIIQSSYSSLLNFLCLERAHQKFEETWESHKRDLARAAAAQDHEDRHPRSISQIRRANTSASAVSEAESEIKSDNKVDIHATSIAKLCPPESNAELIHLLCSWKGQCESIRGEHHIRGLPVRPATETKGCPITVTANHPSEVTNDFRQGPATVPIEVTLSNRLARAPIDFEFALETPDQFDFSGPESFKSTLGAGEEMTIPIEALIHSAGVYNLQNILLTVKKEESASYKFPLQWMVTITDALTNR